MRGVFSKAILSPLDGFDPVSYTLYSYHSSKSAKVMHSCSVFLRQFLTTNELFDRAALNAQVL